MRSTSCLCSREVETKASWEPSLSHWTSAHSPPRQSTFSQRVERCWSGGRFKRTARGPSRSMVTRWMVVTTGSPGNGYFHAWSVGCPTLVSTRYISPTHADAGAGVHLAVDRDRAAVQFHRLLDDYQPEAGSLARADVGGAVKALEQARLVFNRYAYALAAHLDYGFLAVALVQQQRHGTSGGRILHRVGEQVGEDVTQQLFVQIQAAALEMVFEPNDMLLGDPHAQFFDHLVTQFAQIHRLRLELQCARLGLA